jgi:hypothetical protein
VVLLSEAAAVLALALRARATHRLWRLAALPQSAVEQIPLGVYMIRGDNM